MAMVQGAKRKPKSCKACGTVFVPTGNAAKFCPECAAFRLEWSNFSERRRREQAQGVQVGAGSGGQNKLYVATEWTYRKVFLDELYELQNGQCWTCGEYHPKDALLIHHRDHNRKHNELRNLELMCNAVTRLSTSAGWHSLKVQRLSLRGVHSSEWKRTDRGNTV